MEELVGNANQMQEYSNKSLAKLRELIDTNNKTEADIESMYTQTEVPMHPSIRLARRRR